MVLRLSALILSWAARSSSFDSSAWTSEAETTSQSAGAAKVTPAVGALTLA